MQRGDFALAVRLTYAGLRQNWHPILTTISSSSFETVHRETSRKTGDTAKHAFEGFGQMMRDVVFEDLNSGNPRRALVSNLRFAADTHDRRIVSQAVHERSHGVGVDSGIRVNLHRCQPV